MITSSLTRLCGNLFWDPYGSKSSIRHILCETHLIHNVSDTPLAKNHYTCRVVSTPSMQAQSGVEYPSLQTTLGKITSKTNLTSGSPQKSKNSSVPWILPIGCGATSPKAPLNVYFPPTPETHQQRPVSSAIHPQRVPEGPHFLTSGRSIGDAAGMSTEWGEGSEAGVSERGSQYSQRGTSGAAGSIWPKQQVARREEETRLKEEDARGLETAAKKAFAWVQSLEARAGRIHDAAMQAETRAKRMNTMIWEEAEMLCRQAETAKRKRVGMARRGITVRRAKEVGRKERQSRRDEAEPSMKEDVVWNKGQEAVRVGEEVQRRKMEIKQSEEKPSKRRTTKDQVATKGVVASAWERLKGRISRHPHIHKQNLSRIRQYKNNEFDGDGTGVGPGSSSEVDADPETSTPAFVPSSWRVRRLRSTIEVTHGKGRQELRSKSRIVASVRTTSSGISLQYTVKSVHSYKERMNRGPGGYYRHKP